MSRHLPPGRPAGPQTQRWERKRALAFWAPATLAAIFAVLAVVTVVGFDPPGVAFAPAFIALAWGIAAWWERRRNPTRVEGPRGVALRAEPLELRRGGTVSGMVEVGSGAAYEALDVALERVERFDAYEQRQVSTSNFASSWHGVRVTKQAPYLVEGRTLPGHPGQQTFAFQVPAGAAPSYEGDCLSVAYRVAVRVRGDGQRRADVPIWVSP